MKNFSFPESLGFPYLPFISVSVHAMGRLAACLAVTVQEITLVLLAGIACCYHQVGKQIAQILFGPFIRKSSGLAHMGGKWEHLHHLIC